VIVRGTDSHCCAAYELGNGVSTEIGDGAGEMVCVETTPDCCCCGNVLIGLSAGKQLDCSGVGWFSLERAAELAVILYSDICSLLCCCCCCSANWRGCSVFLLWLSVNMRVRFGLIVKLLLSLWELRGKGELTFQLQCVGCLECLLFWP